MARLNADGSDLEYGTFLGGSGEHGTEWSLDLALDGAGRAYVTGWTWGPNFPTTPGAYDTSHNGAIDAFVAKLGMGEGAPYQIYLPLVLRNR